MNTNKIREALEDAYQHFMGMWQMATGPLTKADADMKINRNRDALAELDKAQPGRVLTDEEIERIARYEFRRVFDQDGLHDDNADKRDAFADGLRYARDNYGIGTPAAGLTVEEAEECLVEHLAQYGPDWSAPARSRLRARLAAALTAKPHAPIAPEPLAWVPEDELPDSLPSEAYDALFPYSKVDFIRLFPVYGPPINAAPADSATGTNTTKP